VINLIGIGCVLIAAWCWLNGFRAIMRGLLSRTWPIASGEIGSARVVKKYNSKGREVLRYERQYSYSVDGTVYRGHRIRFGIPNALCWFDPSHPSVRPIRPGARVPVYHSPLRPSVGALERGVSPFVLITLVAGGCIAWIGFQLVTLPG
jgi:hypothetical protein